MSCSAALGNAYSSAFANAATFALQAGRPVRWVADILGHADPAFTLRVYAHVLPDARGDRDLLGRADPQISATEEEFSAEGAPTFPNNSARVGGDPGWARTSDLELRRLAL